MQEERMEKELQEAVQNLIPKDLFTRVSAELDKREEGAKMENVARIENLTVRTGAKKKTGFKTAFQLVAACVALVFVLSGVFYYRTNLMVDSLVDLDVNPGIELLTNQKNRVLKGYATNADGEKVLSGMDLRNVDLQVALNAIVGSMVQQGYMNKDTKGVLVTVQNKNAEKAENLRRIVVAEMENALSTEDLHASVLHQVISTENTNASTFAKENNISLGKAVFVLNLAKKDSSLSAKELAKMRISDIAKLVAEKKIDIRDIIEYDSDDSLWENIADAIEDINEGDDDYIVVETEKNSIAVQPTETAAAETQGNTGVQSKTEENSTADAQKQSGITVSEAKKIALKNAGVAESSVRFIKAEADHDDGFLHYDIEFLVGRTKYEYEIAAADGRIIKAEKEIEDDIAMEEEKNNIVVQPTETAAVEIQGKTGAQSKTDVNHAAGAQAPQKISADRAKSIAFSHAGVSVGQVTELSVEYDNDDGVYEIDFKVGGVEYDYEIAASDGAVRKADAERDD